MLRGQKMDVVEDEEGILILVLVKKLVERKGIVDAHL